MLNNLPSDIMQQHAHIVVSVDTTVERQMQLEIKEFPSPWRLFMQKFLWPPVGDFKLMDMNKIADIIEAGYRYTQDMLEKHGDKLIATQ